MVDYGCAYVAAYNHFEEYEIFRDAINEIVVNKTAAQFNF